MHALEFFSTGCMGSNVGVQGQNGDKNHVFVYNSSRQSRLSLISLGDYACIVQQQETEWGRGACMHVYFVSMYKFCMHKVYVQILFSLPCALVTSQSLTSSPPYWFITKPDPLQISVLPLVPITVFWFCHFSDWIIHLCAPSWFL